MDVKCEHCGTPLTRMPSEIKKSKSGLFFCNKSCSASFNNKGVRRNYKGGAFSYRERAITHYGAVCSRCGYKKHAKVLQVHHKDFQRSNNDISNLEVLCANCHSEEHFVNHCGSDHKTVLS